MANTNNVSFGKPAITGAISIAPAGTELPTDAITPLGGDFKNLGYISDDGLTNSLSIETESIKAWGGDTVKVLQTGKEDTYSFKCIEVLNQAVLETVYGAKNVTGDLDTGLKIVSNSTPLPAQSYVIDQIVNANVLKRIVIPAASITEIGDIVYKDDEVTGYELTVSALPNEEGATNIQYIQKVEDAGLEPSV